MKPWLKWTLIALPLLVGGFIVYKQLRKPKDTTPPPAPNDSKGSGGSGSGSGSGTPAPKPKTDFPMGVGSRGAKVKELQQAIIDNASADVVKLLGKSGADGQFGTGTEKAVKKLLGKTTVANQAEIDKIKGLKAAANVTATRKQFAQNLVNAFKRDPANKDFYATQTMTGEIADITGVNKQAINKRSKTWKPGERIGFSRNATFEISSDGFITAYDNNTYTYFSPYSADVR